MEVQGPRIKYFLPVLFISMGYIDPGRWAACIDSGARFGGDLAFFLLFFNLMACLSQYLSLHIARVTAKNLAQIFIIEYDKFSSIILGVQAEVSIMMSDLAMILGIANGLHMMFGVDLFSAVCVAAVDAFLYPYFSTLVENSKANGLLLRLAVLTWVCYVAVMLIGLPANPISPISVPSKFTGENVYALMSLLGVNFMPHNFYLHSSIFKRFQGSSGEAKARQDYNIFFSVFAIFSIIFLVNYVLMNSASNIFYSSGIELSTFEDAMSLMEQSLWSPTRPLAFFLLILSSHICGLFWGVSGEGRQTILYDFFGIDLPGWLHRAFVRIFVIIPALYCLWYSGAEGMYQMLISTQIMVALVLPPSVVALYRIASSGALMGANKISPVMEFFMMMSFMTMIGLQLIFLGQMVFGDSALRWNMGTANKLSPYFILYFSGCSSLCFTCRVLVTPLRSSAKERPIAQQRRPEMSQQCVHNSLTERLEDDLVGSMQHEEKKFDESPKAVLCPGKVVETCSDAPAPNHCADLPDTEMETNLTPVEESSTVKESCVSSVGSLEQPTIQPEQDPVPETVEDWSYCQKKLVSSKYGEEGETLKPEEASKAVVAVAPALAAEGFINLSGRSDEGGCGAASLPGLSSLGKAARRQMAAVLDEFWGQLYDYHGQFTQAAKAKKLDLALGADSKSMPPASLVKVDSVGKDFGSHLQSVGSTGSDSSGRLPPRSKDMNYQPATLRGYPFLSYMNQTAMEEPTDYSNSSDPLSFALRKKPTNGYSCSQTFGFQQNLPASRNSMQQSDGPSYQLFSPTTLAESVAIEDNPSKYHCSPDVNLSDKYIQRGSPSTPPGFANLVGNPTTAGILMPSSHTNFASRVAPPGFHVPSRPVYGLDARSFWSKQPFQEFVGTNKTSLGAEIATVDDVVSATVVADSEVKLLQSLRHCILKLLKLEGSEWLFRRIGGVDEDLVERVAAKARLVCEAELKEMKPSAVPHCGEGCVWKADLILSFGVWCIHRILQLSLIESRPELWGKYTYVLNRLQGVIDPALLKRRSPTLPCVCLEIAAAYQQGLHSVSPGYFTNAFTLVDIIKDVEVSIFNKKGPSGTVAGDVAFPKGKENLAAVLKRYKRRLSNKPVKSHHRPVASKLSPPGVSLVVGRTLE